LFDSARILALLATLVGVVALAILERPTDSNANRLVEAIEKYKAAHGTYPATPGELVPAQITEVPVYWSGFARARFRYTLSADGFRLGYPLRGFLYRSYDSKTGRWRIND
jgi:hypothetical protein